MIGDGVTIIINAPRPLNDDVVLTSELAHSCQGGRGGFDYASISIWNRTGLASYAETAVPVPPGSRHARVETHLPQDPPFLIWASSTCGGFGTLAFHAANYTMTSWYLSDGPNTDKLPKLIHERGGQVAVRVPAGALSATTRFAQDGNAFFVTSPFLMQGADKSGQVYGTLTTYEPGTDLNRHWITYSPSTPTDSDWQQWKGQVPRPGDFLLVANLTAPFPTETVWMINYGVFMFDPIVANFGFQLPFRTYAQPPP